MISSIHFYLTSWVSQSHLFLEINELSKRECSVSFILFLLSDASQCFTWGLTKKVGKIKEKLFNAVNKYLISSFYCSADDWVECSTGSSFLPHVIMVNTGEVHWLRSRWSLSNIVFIVTIIHCSNWFCSLLGYLNKDNGVLSTRAASCLHNIWQWDSVKCNNSASQFLWRNFDLWGLPLIFEFLVHLHFIFSPLTANQSSEEILIIIFSL